MPYFSPVNSTFYLSNAADMFNKALGLYREVIHANQIRRLFGGTVCLVKGSRQSKQREKQFLKVAVTVNLPLYK